MIYRGISFEQKQFKYLNKTYKENQKVQIKNGVYKQRNVGKCKHFKYLKLVNN